MKTSSFQSMDGTEGGESRGTSVKVANQRSVKSSDFLLRFLAVATSFVAILVLATSKQTKTVSLVVIPGLPPINVEATAKWQYASGFVYLMVANIIALVYAALSMVLSLVTGAGSVLIFIDLMIMALLFSANGAAGAIGLLASQGNTHAQWNKICDSFDKNCRYVGVSLLATLGGALIFMLLIILTLLNLRKRSR